MCTLRSAGFFVVTGLSAWSIVTPSATAQMPPPGTITVHAGVREGPISPYLFGVGVEWTENGNGIWDAARMGLRQDVIDALRALRISAVRFPGGILADHYDWRDGIGDRSRRPIRPNPMDGTPWANNFGSDEFIEFCRTLGAEPLVTANAGTGDLPLATGWQEYFIARGFPVRLWEIGNELYLAEPWMPASIPGNDARIYKTPVQYSLMLSEWGRALRSRDPLVRVGAVAGTTNTSAANAGWLDTLAARNLADMDFVSLHNSFAPMIPGEWDYTQPASREQAHKAMLSCSASTSADIRNVRGSLAGSRGGGAVAITEHFPLFGFGGSTPALLAQLDQSRTLGAALYTATLFHSYIREKVWMANYNLAFSKWFGALLQDTPGGVVRTPVYYVYDLYRNFFGTESLGVSNGSSAYATPQLGVCPAQSSPVLDVTASRDSLGRVYLAVINRDLVQSVVTKVQVEGVLLTATADVRTLTAVAVNTINSASLSPTTVGGSPNAVVPVVSRWTRPSDGRYTFPPRSLTIFQWSPN